MVTASEIKLSASGTCFLSGNNLYVSGQVGDQFFVRVNSNFYSNATGTALSFVNCFLEIPSTPELTSTVRSAVSLYSGEGFVMNDQNFVVGALTLNVTGSAQARLELRVQGLIFPALANNLSLFIAKVQ